MDDANRIPVVTRPSIPSSVWLAAGVWAGVIAAEEYSWRVGYIPRWPSWALGGVLVLLCCVVWIRSADRVTAVWLALIGCMVGLVLGMAAWNAVLEDTAVLASHQTVVVELTGDLREGPFGSRVDVVVHSGDAAGAHLTALISPEDTAAHFGEILSVTGSFSPPAGEWARRSHRGLEAGTLHVRSFEHLGWATGVRGYLAPLRVRMLEVLSDVEGAGGDLLAGVLLGYRERIRGTATEADFRATGLSHLLAVSGTHLAVVVWLAAGLARGAGQGRRTRVVATVVTALAYCAFTGMHVSTVRAAVMVVLSAGVSLLGRRGDSLAALACSAAGIVLCDPSQAFSVGLMLSICAVAGLVVFAPLATSWISSAIPRPAWLAGGIGVAGVAHCATAPLVAVVFGEVSSVGPIANLVAVPLMTVALWLGVMGACVSLVWKGAGLLVLGTSAKILDLIAFFAGHIANLPGAVMATPNASAAVGLGAVVVLFACWAAWPSPGSRTQARMVASMALGAVLLPLVPLSPHIEAEIVVLDVGQGDAIIVRDSGGAVLVDAGEDPAVLRAALQRNHIVAIDAVILTHLHADHIGGLDGVRGTARVGQVYTSVVALPQLTPSILESAQRISGRAPEPLSAGDELRFGGFEMTVLWPDERSSATGDENDESIVLKVERDGFTALLTGDAEERVYAQLDRYGLLDRVDMLKVPHHGSSGVVGDAELMRLRPLVSVVSVGKGNDFGHPVPATVNALQRAGSRVLRTDLSGDIHVLLGTGRISVRTERGRDVIACERIIRVSNSQTPVGAHGLRARRPQTDLSDSRFRAVAARASSKPSEATIGRQHRH